MMLHVAMQFSYRCVAILYV